MNRNPFLILVAILIWMPISLKAETVVYVSENKDKCIAVFSLDEKTGALSRKGEVKLNGAPGSLWLNPDGTRLYASVLSTSEFATLEIDPETGMLKVIGTAPSAGPAAYIYPDKTNRWLLAAYFGDGLVSVSRIRDGIVEGEPVTILEVGEKAHCIQTDPDNRFAFCPHTRELNKIDQFRFDAETGELSLNDPPALQAGEGHGPRHLQFHPNGKWVYIVNEQDKSVTLCDYDSENGTLSMRQTISTHPPNWDQKEGSSADIEISADGRFVYASNRGHDSIAMFSVDADSGTLTSLGQVPTGKMPRSFNLIPGGENFLVAAGQGSNNLTVYRRDGETGTLDPVGEYKCGGRPSWVLGLVLPK